MNPSQELLSKLKFCVIDLETTGGNPKNDEIIEIGMVHVDHLEISDSKSFLVKPRKKIPDFIQRLTSITPDKVKDCPPIEELIDEIVDFIGDRILVAHNTSFDIPFLNGILEKLGKEKLENNVICTNVMTKYLIPEMMSSNLLYTCNMFSIPHKNAHRALEDALSTSKLLIKYLSIFIAKNIRKVNQLYYPRSKFELDTLHLKKDDFQGGLPLTKLHEIGSPFFITLKNSAGTIIDFKLMDPKVKEFENEGQYFSSELEKRDDWQTLTVKLIGCFIEGIIYFKKFLNNFPEEERSKQLEKLSNQVKEQYWQANITKNELLEFYDKTDYLIYPHLVPGQYLLYSLKSLSNRPGVVFKYPSHTRKILNTILGQNNKDKTKKSNTKSMDFDFLEMIYRYSSSLTGRKKIVSLENSKRIKKPKDIELKMEHLTDSEQVVYPFPKVHL